MRTPKNYQDLRTTELADKPIKTQEPSTQFQGGGDPPKPPTPPQEGPSPSYEGPKRPEFNPPVGGPRGGGMEEHQTWAAGEAARRNAFYAERFSKRDDVDKASNEQSPDIEPPSTKPPPIDDPGIPEPPPEKDLMEQRFERIVGGQDRGDEQLPREPNRPDYGDLRREQSQADSPGSRDTDGPKSFAERHPSQGREIER